MDDLSFDTWTIIFPLGYHSLVTLTKRKVGLYTFLIDVYDNLKFLMFKT